MPRFPSSSSTATGTTVVGQRRTIHDRPGNKTKRNTKPGRSAPRLFAGFVSWGMLVVVCVVIWLRSSDASSPLSIAIAGITAFAALPLLIGVVGSFVSRGRTLRLTAGLVASVFFFTTTPLDAVVGCRPAMSNSVQPGQLHNGELSILTANVLYSAGGAEGLAAMIAESNADVVALQEMTPAVFAALADNPVLAEYAYKDNAGSDAPFFTATLAKLPIPPRESAAPDRRVTTTVVPVSDRNPISQQFTITALHLDAPLTSVDIIRWKQQLGSLAQMAKEEPAILVGDFNASEDHRPFRALLASGWEDVHQDKGCGFDATFPSSNRFPVALMRIDHILVTDHFEVVSVDVVDPANGSDHNAVLARVRLTTQG